MRILVSIAILAAATPALARDVYVHGYTTRNGTYVAPHHRSSPDSTPYNNYSTQGNVNPYTGRSGTAQPQFQTESNHLSPSFGGGTYQQPRRQNPYR